MKGFLEPGVPLTFEDWVAEEEAFDFYAREAEWQQERTDRACEKGALAGLSGVDSSPDPGGPASVTEDAQEDVRPLPTSEPAVRRFVSAGARRASGELAGPNPSKDTA